MSIKLITAPTVEPISLDEAKLYLRIDTSPPSEHPDDTLIRSLIAAARQKCEGFSNRAYITQTWDLRLDEFPEKDFIVISKPPLQSLEYLQYKDAAGVLQTVSFLDPSGTPVFETDDYIVDINSDPGRLALKDGSIWPTTYDGVDSVRVRFVAGYGLAEDVPELVKAAIYLALARSYDNRGDAAIDESAERAIQSILWVDRIIPMP